MKQFISYSCISVALVILTFTLLPTLKVIHFYSNQAEIEAKFCENIDKPELNCHGQCHLKKELQINYQVQTTEPTNIKLTGIFVFQSFEKVRTIQITPLQIKEDFFYNYFSLTSEKHSKNLLDPPENLFA